MKIIKLHRRHVLRKHYHCTHAILIDAYDDRVKTIFDMIHHSDVQIWYRSTKRLVPVTIETSPWGEKTSREYRFTEWFGVRDESVLSYILLKLG